MDTARLISNRCRSIDVSGIRRVFELGAKLKDPINLSIGQPDFPVPDAMKRAAIEAIEQDKNGYTLTQGIPALRRRINQHLHEDLGWPEDDSAYGSLVTSGTSGALLEVFMALLEQGDEVIVPDPYFVIYPHLASICGAKAVLCDTYPDFRMTAERIEPLITSRTKAVLINSPANPSGVVLTQAECAEIRTLCRDRGILLISDEIYDEFVFADAQETVGANAGVCPSPARESGSHEDVLVIRGFGKSYGCTGWRMGYAAGPMPIIEQMSKMQQYSFVCAPSMAQWGCLAAFDSDISGIVARYEKRRDMVVDALQDVAPVARPGGAFYAFVGIPEQLGLTGGQFCELALESNVLIIPGNVFSRRDSHVRLSFAVSENRLSEGLDRLRSLLSGAKKA